MAQKKLEDIRSLIGKNRLQEAIEELEALLQQEGREKFRDSHIVLSRRWEEIRLQELEGTIDGNQQQINKNELTKSLIDLVKGLDGLDNKREKPGVRRNEDSPEPEPLWKNGYSVLAMLVVVGILMFVGGRYAQPDNPVGEGKSVDSLVSEQVYSLTQRLQQTRQDSMSQDSVIRSKKDSITFLLNRPVPEPRTNSTIPKSVTQELKNLRASKSILEERVESLNGRLALCQTSELKKFIIYCKPETRKLASIRNFRTALKARGINEIPNEFSSAEEKKNTIRLKPGNRNRNFNLFQTLFDLKLVKSIYLDDEVDDMETVQIHID